MVRDILTTSFETEVKLRGRKPEFNNDIAKQLTTVASLLTNPGYQVGLLFYGPCGNGKTTMVRAIQQMLNVLNDLVFSSEERVGLRILTAKEIVEMRMENPKRWREICCQSPLLAIDDLGMEPKELQEYGNIITPIVDLLSYRYDRRLFTIITSNMSPADLAHIYGERIADRLREMLHGLYFENTTYRK